MRGLAASPLGFLIGLSLGALGGGGSILAVPALVYVAGQQASAATSTSLLIVGTAAVFGMVGHWRAGRVRVAAGVTFGLVGIAGSIAGSALNRRLDPDVLLLAFSGLVLVAAWRMVTGCPSCTAAGEEAAIAAGEAAGVRGVTVLERIDTRTALRVAIAGTGVGFLTGLFGVGGGFVIVPALTLWLAYSMPEAVGTSLLIIAVNSVVALSTRLGSSSIEWGVALPFTISAIVGVLVGKRVADRLPAETMLRWFAVLLVCVGLYTGTRSLVGVL